ncbi:MAG: hypothetical protein ACR2K3_07870 [Nocardioides sp.]
MAAIWVASARLTARNLVPMRDPQRIDDAIEHLRAAWRAHPELRLGQLIFNAAANSTSISPCPQLFYLEDEALIAGLPD